MVEWFNCIFSTQGGLFTFLWPTENRIETRARLLGQKIQKIPNLRRWAGGTRSEHYFGEFFITEMQIPGNWGLPGYDFCLVLI